MIFIPQSAEYISVLLVGAATGCLIFSKQIPAVMKTPGIYPPMLIFVLASWAFDKIGLAQGWWTFSWDYLLGPHILGVPIEEIFLFLCAFIMTSAARLFFDDNRQT